MNTAKTHVCPFDGRRFATKRALAQHRTTMHSCPPGEVKRGPARRGRRGAGRVSGVYPRNRGGNSSSNFRSVSGTDILSSFVVNSSAKVGDVVAGATISPALLDGTRLCAESSLWTRWRPKQLRLEFVPSAGAMTTGSYVVGWVSDPNEWYDNDPSTVSIVSAMRPTAMAHISQKAIINIPCDTTQKWYLTDTSALEDASHGKFVVVLSSSISGLTAGSQFTVVVRLYWTIDFESPILPKKEIEAGTIYADAGYESYFTDSTNDWAGGKKLSLKHKEGGALVPFSGIQPGVLYKLDPSAKLNYVSSTGAKYGIYYGVKIGDFGTNNMAVFHDKSLALKYIKTGQSQYCLDYQSAGDLITPTNPAWTQQTDRAAPVAASAMVERLLELEKLVARLSLQQAAVADRKASDASSSGDFQIVPAGTASSQ